MQALLKIDNREYSGPKKTEPAQSKKSGVQSNCNRRKSNLHAGANNRIRRINRCAAEGNQNEGKRGRSNQNEGKRGRNNQNEGKRAEITRTKEKEAEVTRLREKEAGILEKNIEMYQNDSRKPGRLEA